MRQFFLFLVVFIILSVGFTIPAVEINQGPILYLPFEDADNPVDHSDNPVIPKINGKLEQVKGKFGKALRFKRKEANAVEVPTVAKFADMRILTIVAWAMTNGIKGLTGCRSPRNASASTSVPATTYLLWVNRKCTLGSMERARLFRPQSSKTINAIISPIGLQVEGKLNFLSVVSKRQRPPIQTIRS